MERWKGGKVESVRDGEGGRGEDRERGEDGYIKM